MAQEQKIRGNQGEFRVLVRPCHDDLGAVVLDLGDGSEFLIGLGSTELDRVIGALGSRLSPEQRDSKGWVKHYPRG